ncbi:MULTISPECIES: hypothetical protein [Nosocomiicoccus]|uniref:Uncharacterized protein n=1 Tax=Nosocomiicoccus massiliensis TaxID=1232430 RepID=A0AAF0YMW8_9STAP|nr:MULTISPECIES: hypothetical protein [Nosocomiicoccus]MDK6863864.1 hypothetical protein [Nosocomiicoccus ampullae]OFL49071.1 hypothetical protein HMPREF2767_01560 [Nosocomiicoccus sp. HMSC067E10]OFO52427.1 hypothetical protein HMPREF3029_06040 [Nosocomiicoccus sp. HMSC059G07]OFS61254.1 hypothetical protein HMPREF3177_08220 [Nosocomiicoccus sp. HMSC09A07]WOS95431.1 hypothetical protein CJ229_004820 [Nosocomiicoccus massiliensis]
MMKNWQVIIYAFVGALFTGGIIFSITSVITQENPLSYVLIFALLLVLFILFTLLLFSYKKHRPSVEDMTDDRE